MRLITRFRLLIGIAALATLMGLGVAYWGVGAVVRQVSAPYGDITIVFKRLDIVKRDFESQFQTFRRVVDRQNQHRANGVETTGLLAPDRRTEDIDRLLSLRDEIHEELEALSVDPAFVRHSGANVSNSITSRVYDLAERMMQCRQLLIDGEFEALEVGFDDTSVEFETLHRMIEDLEGRLLSDMELSLEYTAEARRQVNSLLIVCLVLAAMAVVLVFLLQDRWFSKPLHQLRDATAELSQGNFEHRIPIESHDELGLVSQEINDMARTITQMQDQLVERERLAAIGEMMRRIVHNLRNPLAGIRSLAELTRTELEPDSDQFESQQRIIRTVDRFEQWLSQMLQSTRPLDVHVELIDLPEFVLSTLEPQRATAQGTGTQLSIHLDSAPEKVNIDPVHFQHVLIALVANAIEACQHADGHIRVVAMGDSANWRLVVEDNGPGIDADLHARVFEPYFTTKKHGSGIGLAVVRNIIHGHGGVIAVDRSGMGGARFEVTLGKV